MAENSSERSGYGDGEGLHDVNSRAVDSHLHVNEIVNKPKWHQAWEHVRPQWALEAAGEFIGVFIYVYAGLGPTAGLVIAGLTDQPALSNLLQVSLGYAFGAAFAITITALSSGAHLNPAVTVAFAVWRNFPWRKVPLYIFFQVFGAFVASMVVYSQYRPYILELEAGLKLAGKEALIFSTAGPAGIFSIYPNPGIDLKWTFLNEFFSCFFLGLIIWGILDPSNIFVSATTAPLLLGLAYGVVIMGYVPATIALNTARELGCRLATIALWGTGAWGGHYPAIANLASFPATILAATVYEVFLTDTTRVVTKDAREVIANNDRHRAHKAYRYNLRAQNLRGRAGSDGGEKGPSTTRIENRV